MRISIINRLKLNASHKNEKIIDKIENNNNMLKISMLLLVNSINTPNELINNPDSLSKKLCPTSGIFVLLIIQLISLILIITERICNTFYTKSKPATICIIYAIIGCILIWSISDLFNTCAINYLTNLDTYLCVRAWFIAVVTYISLQLLIGCRCKIYCKQLCNQQYIKSSRAKNNVNKSVTICNNDMRNPLQQSWPEESVTYADL